MQIKSGDRKAASQPPLHRVCAVFILFFGAIQCNEEMDHKNADVYIIPLHKNKENNFFFSFALKQTIENAFADAFNEDTWFIEHDNGECINY